MPIDFRCHQCNKLLRTPDNSAGRQAKCPQCGTVLTVPNPAAELPLDDEIRLAPPEPSAPAGEVNPYQAPRTLGIEPVAAASTGELRSTPIVIGDVLSRTWNIFKGKWGTCIGAMLVVLIVSWFIQFGLQVFFGVVVSAAKSEIVNAIAAIFLFVALMAVNSWLQAGMAYLMVRVARGVPSASVGDVFAASKYIVPYFVATILVSLIVLVGLVLLIVPGIIAILMLWPYQFLIVDRDLGTVDSLTTARAITVGNKVNVFLLFLLVGLVGSVAVVLTCGIGGLVVGPYVSLLLAVTYLTMTGQPTAVDTQGR